MRSEGVTFLGGTGHAANATKPLFAAVVIAVWGDGVQCEKLSTFQASPFAWLPITSHLDISQEIKSSLPEKREI